MSIRDLILIVYLIIVHDEACSIQFWACGGKKGGGGDEYSKTSEHVQSNSNTHKSVIFCRLRFFSAASQLHAQNLISALNAIV